MSISFNGYKNNTVTMENETATVGYPVALNSEGKAIAANDGVAFIGVCVAVRGDICCVQTDGYIELGFSGTAPSYGFSGFTADGNGGVKSVTSATAPKAYTVVKVDTAKKTVGFIM
ncbi:MAG: hypothetical protein ACI4IG_06935 [Eubacterium sp.]